MAIAALLLAVIPGLAQAPAPEANSGVHVETGISYFHLTNSSGPGANATVAWARVPLTNGRWSGVLQLWNIPAAEGQIYLGEVEYREPLNHVLRCGKCSGSAFDLSQVRVYLRGGLGPRRDSLGRSRAAYGFFGGISVPAGQIAGAKVDFHFDVGFIGSAGLRKPGQPGFFLTNSAPVGAGVTLHF